MANLRAILEKYCPEIGASERERILYVFYPFMFGIYPYTAVTEKQRNAMQAAGVDFAYPTVYELTCTCLTRLLGGDP